MNILLCCSAGMSTSLLVQKMKKEAKEMGMDAKIWAVAMSSVQQDIKSADVLLVGPQIRFKLAELKKLGEAYGIPVEMISPTDYGMMNGKKVIEFALRLKKSRC
ncbi:PTS sugar transporter subunit IIB [Marinisporobacter balticus]|uniref:PTS system cellobiose-specific IIB component n=1 Tax=Marinisporobacter balticus TaxID=2018667 RepID=A0A4R2KZX6_9FIRM|nr:PTS sugar transporter subunit IIB [Marinisporobacter balticus]TCO76946.1 PTS system cellobiose-specific IIB component [Marinisporobacter balticus]